LLLTTLLRAADASLLHFLDAAVQVLTTCSSKTFTDW
jgi:hypothetical protein